MEITKIVIPTPYDVGDVNAFLVKGDALSIVDAGPKTQEAYEALEYGIKNAGYRFDDIEQVILTHHHPDHAGWVDAFPRAEILGHEYIDHWMKKNEEFLRYREAFYEMYLRKQAVPEENIQEILSIRRNLELYGNTPLTKYIQDGDEVPGHPGLIAYYTPGHAQSHLIFHDQKTKEVIGGDLLLEKIASNPLIEPPVDLSFDRPRSLVQYQASLRFLATLDVAKLYAGHGNEIVDVKGLVKERLQKDAHRTNQVYEILSEPKTVYEVTKALYPAVYESQLGLTLSKTQGYLDVLVKEDRVRCEQMGDQEFYSRI
ncbi:MBL fold metallo-hydrolase [Ureibacillus terrenus]|uniref:MBL fold metallo-hydrolase n=1 Tax=Ureibacillus terrenus TaxID=118246 RepID=UPI002E1F478B|nr:MBL fold metallo-hydrolase [Ureibacillus terrenus]